MYGISPSPLDRVKACPEPLPRGERGGQSVKDEAAGAGEAEPREPRLDTALGVEPPAIDSPYFPMILGI